MFSKAFVVSTIFSVSNCWFADSKGLTSVGRDTSFDKDRSSNNNSFKKHKNSVLCADLGNNIYQKLIFNREGNFVDVVLQKTTAEGTLFVVHSRKTVTYLNTLGRITIEGLNNEVFSGKVVIHEFTNTSKSYLNGGKSAIQFTVEDCCFIEYVQRKQAKKSLQAWSSVIMSGTCFFLNPIDQGHVQFNQKPDGRLFAQFKNQEVDVSTSPLLEKKIKNALNCNDIFFTLA